MSAARLPFWTLLVVSLFGCAPPPGSSADGDTDEAGSEVTDTDGGVDTDTDVDSVLGYDDFVLRMCAFQFPSGPMYDGWSGDDVLPKCKEFVDMAFDHSPCHELNCTFDAEAGAGCIAGTQDLYDAGGPEGSTWPPTCFAIWTACDSAGLAHCGEKYAFYEATLAAWCERDLRCGLGGWESVDTCRTSPGGDHAWATCQLEVCGDADGAMATECLAGLESAGCPAESSSIPDACWNTWAQCNEAHLAEFTGCVVSQ